MTLIQRSRVNCRRWWPVQNRLYHFRSQWNQKMYSNLNLHPLNPLASTAKDEDFQRLQHPKSLLQLTLILIIYTQSQNINRTIQFIAGKAKSDLINKTNNHIPIFAAPQSPPNHQFRTKQAKPCSRKYALQKQQFISGYQNITTQMRGNCECNPTKTEANWTSWSNVISKASNGKKETP